MDFQTYKAKTDNAVIMLNDLGYGMAVVEQANMDTESLISRLNGIKEFVEAQIRDLKRVNDEVKSDNEQAEYDKFANECKNGEHKVVRWRDLPQMAKYKIMQEYKNSVQSTENVTIEQWYEYIGKAADSFKKEHNIEKIEL